jgi:hypothetical protein
MMNQESAQLGIVTKGKTRRAIAALPKPTSNQQSPASKTLAT